MYGCTNASSYKVRHWIFENILIYLNARGALVTHFFMPYQDFNFLQLRRMHFYLIVFFIALWSRSLQWVRNDHFKKYRCKKSLMQLRHASVFVILLQLCCENKVFVSDLWPEEVIVQVLYALWYVLHISYEQPSILAFGTIKLLFQIMLRSLNKISRSRK